MRSLLWVKLLTPSLTGFCCSQQWLPSAGTQKQFHHSSQLLEPGTESFPTSLFSVLRHGVSAEATVTFHNICYRIVEQHLKLSKNSCYFNRYQVGVFKNIYPFSFSFATALHKYPANELASKRWNSLIQIKLQIHRCNSTHYIKFSISSLARRGSCTERYIDVNFREKNACDFKNTCTNRITHTKEILNVTNSPEKLRKVKNLLDH